VGEERQKGLNLLLYCFSNAKDIQSCEIRM